MQFMARKTSRHLCLITTPAIFMERAALAVVYIQNWQEALKMSSQVYLLEPFLNE